MIKLYRFESEEMYMKNKKRIFCMLTLLLCMGLGVAIFAATYKGNLVYNGNKIGYGQLDHNKTSNTASGATYSDSSNGRYAFVMTNAYSKSGTLLATKSDTGSLVAAAAIAGVDPYYYKSLHTIKKSSDGSPLASTTLYSYK